MCERIFLCFHFKWLHFSGILFKMLPPNRPLPSALFYFIYFLSLFFFFIDPKLSPKQPLCKLRVDLLLFSLLLLSSYRVERSFLFLFSFSFAWVILELIGRSQMAANSARKVFKKYYYSETCIKRTPLGNAVVSA